MTCRDAQLCVSKFFPSLLLSSAQRPGKSQGDIIRTIGYFDLPICRPYGA